jgi:hypothetical protein
MFLAGQSIAFVAPTDVTHWNKVALHFSETVEWLHEVE